MSTNGTQSACLCLKISVKSCVYNQMVCVCVIKNIFDLDQDRRSSNNAVALSVKNKTGKL